MEVNLNESPELNSYVKEHLLENLRAYCTEHDIEQDKALLFLLQETLKWCEVTLDGKHGIGECENADHMQAGIGSVLTAHLERMEK